jgi:hypothetical protein
LVKNSIHIELLNFVASRVNELKDAFDLFEFLFGGLEFGAGVVQLGLAVGELGFVAGQALVDGLEVALF